MPSSSILLSAGEASGDLYAGRLAQALQLRGVSEIFGMGGPHMREAGVDLIADSADVAVMGISEVVHKLGILRRTLDNIVQISVARKPQLAVLTDFPGFHLRLARRLNRHNIPCVYFIAPQFWAWRPWRARIVKRRFTRALCIFPFEEAFYRGYGVDATFIGHPLVDIVKPSMSREEFLARDNLDASRPIVALLPGSRQSEIGHHLSPILGATRLIAEKVPGAQFILALAPGLESAAAALGVSAATGIRTISGATYDVVSSADVAIVASGTASVETALLGTPMIVIYRFAPLTATILRRLVTTPHFAMPNLIAERKIVPELFQEDCNPQRIAQETLRYLDSPDARAETKSALAEVRARLGTGGAIDRAAEIISSMLLQQSK
jgi:lipid-A-disaccharide synthase